MDYRAGDPSFYIADLEGFVMFGALVLVGLVVTFFVDRRIQRPRVFKGSRAARAAERVALREWADRAGERSARRRELWNAERERQTELERRRIESDEFDLSDWR